MKNQKILLAIDTVSPEASLTLWKGEKAWSLRFGETRTYSQSLISLFDRLLRKAHVVAGAISGVHVITGPGSYTSARIGVTFANALGFSHRIPVMGETLFAVVSRAFPEARVVAVDAGRGNAFIATRSGAQVATWDDFLATTKAKKSALFVPEGLLKRVPHGAWVLSTLDRTTIKEALVRWQATRPAYPSFTTPYYLLPPHLTISKKRSPFSRRPRTKRAKK